MLFMVCCCNTLVTDFVYVRAGNKVGDEEEREEDVRAAVGARIRAHHAPGGIVTGLAWHLAWSA